MPVFAKWIKKFTSIFAEKTPIKPDDFELEHFLFYHGLVGASPENQRKFKDVRADLLMTIESGSSQQVASTLKLGPMFWEEKLKSIVAEVTDRALLIRVLAPDVSDEAITFDDIPLLHTDWQVRSNAALLLAHIEATEVAEKLHQSLRDTADSAIIAFCHIATALGKLGQQSSEAVLVEYLSHDEPWIRVDTAGALAQLTKGEPSKHVINALLDKHALSDYTAIAVTRSTKPSAFFEKGDEHLVAAGCQVVLEVLNSSTQTFSNETVVEAGIHECFPALAKLLTEKPTCATTIAAVRLAQWLDDHRSYTLLSPPPHSDIEKVLAYYKSDDCLKLAKETLNSLSGETKLTPIQLCELRSAVDLVSRLGDSASAASIKRLLKQDHPLLDDAIKALEELKARDASAEMIKIAKDLVDLDFRCEQPKQLNPILEKNKAHAKTYWLILKALGAMPSKESIDFLLKASQDHAPDKRSQALESLVSAVDEMEEGDMKGIMPEFSRVVGEALSDPSADVRKNALRGVAAYELVTDLKKVVGLTKAREVSTQREAFDTLSELAKKGHKKDVVETVAQALKTEPDVHKRQKLRDFIDDTSR